MPKCSACKKRKASCFQSHSDPAPSLCAPCFVARWHAKLDQVLAAHKDRPTKRKPDDGEGWIP